MKIFIGADHRGFELKRKLIDWLKSQGRDAEDCGNTRFDPEDDYPDFAKYVATSVIASVSEAIPDEIATSSRHGGTPRNDIGSVFGIVICGSGIGVCVAVNRYKGIVCALGFDIDQVLHGRENDHVNVLSLPSDYVDFEKAKQMVEAFLRATPKTEEKYTRRIKKLDI